MRLGAGEAVAFFASAAVCGDEDGSRGAGGDETGLGAGGRGGVVRGEKCRFRWLLWGDRQGESVR